MKIVYIDGVFLLNTCINYLLLLCAARIGGQIISRLRMLIAAVLGGIYAVLVFLPPLAFLLHPLCKIAVAVGMVLVAFGASKFLLRLSLIFFAVSFALGGAIYGISFLGGTGLSLENGVLYSYTDIRIFLLAAALCYLVFTIVLRRRGKGATRSVVPAILKLGDRALSIRVLIDTGNNLVDAATNCPVVVIDGALAERLLEQSCPTQEELMHPVEFMTKASENGQLQRFRLLPYQAVGVSGGLLLAVRLDSAKIGTKQYNGMLAALSPTALSDGGDYQGLIGGES